MSIPSNSEWKFWGKRDPLWAVAAWKNRQKEGPKPWTDEEFYALGESDWRDFERHWERYGLGHGSVVEIGCGAGRITRVLSRRFEQVHAFDVSEDMLNYASQRITAGNVSFTITDGSDLPLQAATVDAVFSTHVFQHLDSTEYGYRYFEEIARVLKPGGTMMIHVPILCWPCGAGKLTRFAFRWEQWRAGQRSRRLRRAIESGGTASLMRMNSYEMKEFYHRLPKLGFVDIEISVFVTASNGDPHPFLLARLRPA